MNGNQSLKVVSGQVKRVGVTLLLLGSALAWHGVGKAQAQDGPTIIRPKLFAGVHQPGTTKNWMPTLRFVVFGPVASGSQFVVDFTKLNGTAWMSLDCPTKEIEAGESLIILTPRETSNQSNGKKHTTGTGIFGFKIRLKNELTNQNEVLYSGKFKVDKVSKSMGTPNTKNDYDYYVDHDWVLPFGYLRFAEDEDVASMLEAEIWFKDDLGGADLAGYVFYKGKQIGSTEVQGIASTIGEDLRTISGDKGAPRWQSWHLAWYRVALTAQDPASPNAKIHYLDKNPGEYEIKVLRKGKLCRSAKFTVGDDGKIVDNGTGNFFGKIKNSNTVRAVIPVKLLGNTDGTWNKLAWKTHAFYGNPLAGFTAP